MGMVTPGRRNEQITAIIPKSKKINSTFLVYHLLLRGSEEEDNVNPSHTVSTPDSLLDAQTAAPHSQICGVLIETMAMSRTSSFPVSSLFKLMM
jgi:hypothetical protein